MSADRSRLLGRLVMVALLALGVLGMHGLTSVATPRAPVAYITDVEMVQQQGLHTPGHLEGHDAAHLAENCLFFLTAAVGAVVVLCAFRARFTGGSLLRLVSGHRAHRPPPGPAPPSGWSHLELAVLLR